MEQASPNHRLAASLGLGFSWGLAFSARFLAFFNASQLQKIELFCVWGLLFSLLWYAGLGWIWNHSSNFFNRKVLLVSVCGGLVLFITAILVRDPYILANISSINPSSIGGILRIVGMLATIASLASLVWLAAGCSQLVFPKLRASQLNLVDLVWVLFPFIAISGTVILANLLLYPQINKLEQYQLRTLPTNTLEELIRRSPDTTPQLRVYLAFQENYPGASLFTTPAILAASGLDPAELMNKGSVKQVIVTMQTPEPFENPLGELRVGNEILAGDNGQRFVFVDTGKLTIDDVWLLQTDEQFYFVPVAALQNWSPTP